jgi:hypothetical protein
MKASLDKALSNSMSGHRSIIRTTYLLAIGADPNAASVTDKVWNNLAAGTECQDPTLGTKEDLQDRCLGHIERGLATVTLFLEAGLNVAPMAHWTPKADSMKEMVYEILGVNSQGEATTASNKADEKSLRERGLYTFYGKVRCAIAVRQTYDI